MPELPKSLRTLLPLVIVGLSLAVFGYFMMQHPALRHTITHIQPGLLILLVGLYGLFTLALAEVYRATLALCGKRLDRRENFLLTAYSSITNFFGPLQSGPGVRAAYLKRRHQVKLADYGLATLIYYALYAITSALFLFVGSSYWWLALPAALAVAIISYGVIRAVLSRANRKGSNSHLTITPRLVTRLLAATVIQLAIQALIYYVELHAIHQRATIRQAVSYSGAANFALFVSLTPGAIGFREAFLEFSRRLHHIGTNSILAAGLIDRAAYVVLLGILFVIVLASHARQRLSPANESNDEV